MESFKDLNPLRRKKIWEKNSSHLYKLIEQINKEVFGNLGVIFQINYDQSQKGAVGIRGWEYSSTYIIITNGKEINTLNISMSIRGKKIVDMDVNLENLISELKKSLKKSIEDGIDIDLMHNSERRREIEEQESAARDIWESEQEGIDTYNKELRQYYDD